MNEKGRGKNRVISTLWVRRAPRDRRRGLLIAGEEAFSCALGRSGMRAPKREGDGATPVGAMRVVAGWYRPDRLARPATLVPLTPITARDGWCDAPADPNYNRPVRLPYAASHEKMLRDDRLYDVCLVLDWNLLPFGRRRNGGSAIFLHVAKPGFPPTEGCIAVAPETMRRLLPRIGPGTVVKTLF
ncbi:L,D-transpeptidase family protein [Oricola thermophila]|uniref:L,D-transpeptidase family protein n=1 Tax=Oricola thermophila TaxID=2742145 RepID=A0A6N1VG50_9HYPH|nr:L,D-transpeptidase family protein [Oricola thermophila]QKV19881.1 L,D-transpeptidase family protein [Oricola thermophila]